MKQKSVIAAARIRVVEDNVSDVCLLHRALNRQGLLFELFHFTSGTEALAFVRRQGAAMPDLILLDLNLVQHTGEDVLREIRSTRYLDKVPVCMWSSSGSSTDQARLKQLGISQFITKPTGLEQFMEIGKTIKDLLVGRGHGR